MKSAVKILLLYKNAEFIMCWFRMELNLISRSLPHSFKETKRDRERMDGISEENPISPVSSPPIQHLK